MTDLHPIDGPRVELVDLDALSVDGAMARAAELAVRWVPPVVVDGEVVVDRPLTPGVVSNRPPGWHPDPRHWSNTLPRGSSRRALPTTAPYRVDVTVFAIPAVVLLAILVGLALRAWS